MCGIVGCVGASEPVKVLVEGLRRLEYRGYDSAGIALGGQGGLTVAKAVGDIDHLAVAIPSQATGAVGIGHTRWATHGEPSLANAHPHVDPTRRIAIVHNGIIENADSLRGEIARSGAIFASDTDSEVLAHLIARSTRADLDAAVREALDVVDGCYGLAVIDARSPSRLVVARRGSPVLIGIAEGARLVASDAAALEPFVTMVVDLDDGDVAVLSAGDHRVVDVQGARSHARAGRSARGQSVSEKGGHGHFMLKEIREQPSVIDRVLAGRLRDCAVPPVLDELSLTPAALREVTRVKLLGCGSAFYAGLAGARIIESLTGLPADAEPASEFRYRGATVETGVLYVAVSQSGETIDTLRAVEMLQDAGARPIAVVNVPGSSLERRCTGSIHLRAGPESSVASTKTYSATVVALSLLGLALAWSRDVGRVTQRRLVAGLHRLPSLIADALCTDDLVSGIAASLVSTESAYYIGRALGHAVALEGAQKMKEVAYLHAEAYPASELKHGPLALVSQAMPTVAVVPEDGLVAKNMSTLAEIRARRGSIIGIGPCVDLERASDVAVLVPRSEPELAPAVMSVPLQLLAYRTAVARGTRVDRPRNLAKSVTVE